MAKKTVMEDALVNNYPWTTNTIAEELGMKLNYFRVWKAKIEKDKKIAAPAIGSLFCMQDPTSKNRLLYSDAYVDKLREIRGGTARRDRIVQAAEMSMKNAVMKLTIPIFDKNIADIITKKFKTEAALQEHLKDYIKKMAVPALKRIEEIKARYERDLQAAMNGEEPGRGEDGVDDHF